MLLYSNNMANTLREFGAKIHKNRVISKIWYVIIFIFVALLIVLLKAYTFPGLNVYYFYTLIITTFMFSRVVGSFLYKKRAKKIDYNYNPKITFIIPCKNEEKAIYHTIQECLEVEYPKNKVEVIAVNDGSTDNTLKEMLRVKEDYKDRSLEIVNWKVNKGKREGMNYGFLKAKGEIVIQLDSDSYPMRNTIRHLIMPFKDKKVAAVSAHTDPANKDENILTKMQTAYYFMSFRALKASEGLFDMVFFFFFCCAAYRKKYVLKILDKFNSEKFLGRKVTYGDDRALTNQMIKAGYKTIYSYEARAYTIVPNNLKQFLKQQVRWKKGWFINSIRASKFVAKRDAFVAFTYFFPLILITLMTPIVAFSAFIISPIIHHTPPTYYALGIMLVSCLLYSHYKIFDGGKYGKYMLLWSILNMTVLSYVIIYALYDLKNIGWGTR